MNFKNNLYYIISLIINYAITSFLWGIHYRFGDAYGMKQDAFLSLMFGLPALFFGLILIVLFSNILIKKYSYSYLKVIVVGNIIFSICTIAWIFIFVEYFFGI